MTALDSTQSDAIRFDKRLNESLRVFFTDMLTAALTSPRTAKFYLDTLRWQNKAAAKREKLEAQGLHVPPILILSITNRCNLLCKGCFNNALRSPSSNELSEGKLRNIVREADDLGVSFMVISGGEPLTRPEIIDIAEENPHIIFVMFTNGTLIDEKLIDRLSKAKNLVPLISLEGHQAETDNRRGTGVYRSVVDVMGKLRRRRVFFGTSITVTRMNFEGVTQTEFVDELYDMGCRLFIYDEYTPVREGTDDWVLTSEQRTHLGDVRKAFKEAYKAVFLNLPADEEDVGGCLAAGRGFIHINAVGDVEPCPFIPYSDTNLNGVSLRTALESNLLKEIRERHSQLPMTSGGCSLWSERKWLQSLK